MSPEQPPRKPSSTSTPSPQSPSSRQTKSGSPRVVRLVFPRRATSTQIADKMNQVAKQHRPTPTSDSTKTTN